MKITEGKRLAAILGAYIAIFSVCVLVPAVRSHIVWLALSPVAVFSAVLLLRERRRVFLLKKMILIVLMSISVVSACFHAMNFLRKTEFAAAHYPNGEVHAVKVGITEISYAENYGSAYEAILLDADGEKTGLGIVLSLPYDGEFSVGDIVSFEGVFSLSKDEYAIYRKAEGVFLSAEAESVIKTGALETKKEGIFEKIRISIKSNFERYLERDEAGFATAILTGDRANLSGGVRLAFTRIGISHILAVSGLHLAIMIGGLDLLCRWTAIPRKVKNILLIVCSCLFACICGLSASVIRAAVMLSFIYLADTIGEQNDSLTSLFIAIFGILIFRPTAVYDVGMWMSFLATLGILVTAPAVPKIQCKRCPRLLNKLFGFLISLVCITVSATFFTLPVTYIAFGGLSLLSPLANLIFVPLTQIILYLLIMLMVLGGIPLLAEPIGAASQALISFACDTAERLSDIKGIYISLRYPFVFWMIVLLIAGVLTVLMIRKAKPVYIFAVFALCVVFYGVGYLGYTKMEENNSYVYLETDGKSDAVGIVSRGETVLVDISTGGYSVLSSAADRMEDFCACEIDVLILTHYHSYHPNTLRKLMDRVKIHRIYLPEPLSEEDILFYQTISEEFGKRTEITVYPADGTQHLQVGNVSLSLPENEYIKRSAHPIVCFSAEIGEKGFSYLGESATETDFSDYISDVMLFGSNGPSMRHIFDSEPLLESELVVFSDRSHAELTEAENLAGKTVFSEDYGGWLRILFE